jgi:hypothetical protein
MSALDAIAQQQHRCLIAMARLALGLTGWLGYELLRACLQVSIVQVSLLSTGDYSILPTRS